MLSLIDVGRVERFIEPVREFSSYRFIFSNAALFDGWHQAFSTQTLLLQTLSPNSKLAFDGLIDLQDHEADVEEDTAEYHDDKDFTDFLSKSEIADVLWEPVIERGGNAYSNFVHYVLVANHFRDPKTIPSVKYNAKMYCGRN